MASGCSGSNALTVGTPADASNNGSYSGATLNSRSPTKIRIPAATNRILPQYRTRE